MAATHPMQRPPAAYTNFKTDTEANQHNLCEQAESGKAEKAFAVDEALILGQPEVRWQAKGHYEKNRLHLSASSQ